MKRSIVTIMWSLLAALTLGFVGCNTPVEEPSKPEFPEKITANVAAGEEFKFTFDANMKWTLKIPTEVASYFKFIVGESERYTIKGEAGSHEVTIGVANTEEFDNVRVCAVEMTMGEETRVVAELTRGSKERTLDVYVAEYDATESVFVSDEEGNYQYVSTPSSDKLEWMWCNEQWMLRFAVDANFSWNFGVDTPDWIDINKTSGSAGRTEIFFRTVDEKRPLEDTTCTLEFCDSRDRNGDGVVDDSDIIVVKSFTTTIEGCKNLCEVDIVSAATFNAAGEFFAASSDSYVESAYGRITSPRGVEFFAVGKSADGTYSLEGAEWIELEVEDFPSEAGEEGVWMRNFSLNVMVNESTELRYGALVAIPMPQAGATNYADYVVCEITQEGVEIIDTSEPIYAYDEDVMKGFAAKFEKLENNTWPWQGSWANIPYAYRLTLRNNNSGDDLVFRKQFANYRIFGYNGYSGNTYDPATSWVTISESDPSEAIENGYIIRSRLGTEEGQFENTMPGKQGQNEATFIFYDDKGVAFALIHVVLDPEFSPYPKVEGDVKFVDENMAIDNGVFLEAIVSGDEDYNAEDAFMGILQYRLTLNSRCNSIALLLPDYTMAYPYQAWLTSSKKGKETTVTANSSESVKGRITFYGSNNYNVVLQLIVVYNAE
ncbi:MAG: hypothetical protein II323_04510 [Tidjanibacter sp.]|nr:hypothetical protein [Tidjanibacter sp.]